MSSIARQSLLVLAVLCSGAAAVAAGEGPRLRYLRHLVESGRLSPAPERVAVALVVEPGFDLGSVAAAGASRRGGEREGEVLRTARVVPVLAPPSAFAVLARLPGVVLAETSWFPRSPPPPLDVSRPEIGSPFAWAATDPAGRPVTGEGVLIADFDSGIDVFHPMFFRPDGGSFAWIDADASGDFTAGADAVDLDGDGGTDPGETLSLFEAVLGGGIGPNPAGFDPGTDWLYLDLDGNGSRDFGRAAGFDELSPSFGEPLFVADDRDGDGRLDAGEPLLALGSSKVRAVRERGGTVRRRGVDLIDTEPDSYAPHGTWVAGILLGGLAAGSRFAGQAPGAELIVADLYYPTVPPFDDDMAAAALWARGEGARVMLYESGNWVWSWLDGSLPNEVTMGDLAAEGHVQVTAAGNLTGGGQAETRALAAGVEETMELTTPSGRDVHVVWPSLLWRGNAADVAIALDLPGGATLVPCLCASSETAGAYAVYSDRTVSPRGTVMASFEIRAASGTDIAGTWTFRLTAGRALEVQGYSWDDQSGWGGVTRWERANDLHTVTTPATGDVSIVVGAYSPRPPAGDINAFSGRGTRLDGVPVLDLAAPGSVVFSTAPQQFGGIGAINAFGGTSSALPHAAGAAALLAQLNPTDPHAVIERLLRASALADAFTGGVPNDTWGMGKLRLGPALEEARKPSLLREDSVTALAPLTPDKAGLFPGGALTSLRLAGANGFSHEGEGSRLTAPGSDDGDAFLLAHVDPGVVDPEGLAVLADRARPLVFYQLAGDFVLRLVKRPGGIGVGY